MIRFDGVTHTQKAIQNLRAEFKLFLKKNHDQVLPYINNHRSRFSNSLQGQAISKNIIRSKSRYENTNDNQIQQSKNINTICFQGEREQSKIHVLIIRPRSKKMTKIILPRFINQNHSSSTIKHQYFAQSLQNIESSLVQSAQYSRSPQQAQFLSNIGSITRRKMQKKSNSQKKTTQKQIKNGSMPIINLDKTYSNRQTRQNCFSPWQDKEQEVEGQQF